MTDEPGLTPIYDYRFVRARPTDLRGIFTLLEELHATV